MSAPVSTSPTLMISEGWIVMPAMRIQFWLPPTLVPIGESTSSWSANATARMGSARRFQATTDSRDATTRATVPITAKTAWLRKIV